MNRESHTYREIWEQPAAWERALSGARRSWPTLEARLGPALRRGEVVLTGCGSSYFLALAAGAQLRLTRGPVAVVPASEVFLYSPAALGSVRDYTLIGFSRSGETTETVLAADHARKEHGASVLAVTCQGDSTLARRGDAALVVESGQETSVVMTKSFTSILVATQVMAARLAASPLDSEVLDSQLDRLPETLDRRLAEYAPLCEEVGARPFEKRVFLGSGLYYGLAREADLKMKEMAIVTSEVYHCLEFRHGPIAIVDGSTLVTCFVSDAGREYEVPLLGELKEMGATLFVVCESAGPEVSRHADYLVELRSGLGEAARAALYMPFAQLAAYACACSRGESPDHPRNLTKVVKLSG